MPSDNGQLKSASNLTLVCQDFVSIKKARGQKFRSLEVRRRLIALKNEKVDLSESDFKSFQRVQQGLTCMVRQKR